jgi:RNA polymerase sigma factor (sigma-70 family)
VAAATLGDGEPARAALEDLCAAYWYPLYAYLRRRGSNADEAADLVQGFFTTLIEKGYVGQADPERGRFRGFLSVALRNYVSKERAKQRTQKRGGGRIHLPLDFEDGERRYSLEPVDALTPEALYERQWALTLLDRALERLAEGQRGSTPAKAERFDALRPYLTGAGGVPYVEVGASLGISETAVKVAVFRLRACYRDILRDEIAQTVETAAEIDDEIRRLMEAVRS